MELYTMEGFKINTLEHHGIKGQRWGIRRYQNPDGTLTPEGKSRYSNGNYKSLISKKDKAYNLDKWGQDEDNNVLFVTGLSGSGKSTLAHNISNTENAEHIGLDFLYENPKSNEKYLSKEFVNYVKTKVPKYKNIVDNYEKYDSARFNSNSKEGKEYWNTMDKVRDAIMDYGKDSYGNKKIVVEGIQLYDSTLYADKNEKYSALNDKPVIVKSTSALKSTLQAMSRDEVKAKDFIDQYKTRSATVNKLNEFSDDLDKVNRGRYFVTGNPFS